MPGPNLFQYADSILDGQLADQLLRLREEGESFDSIARWLQAEHGIAVSYETVRRWCKDLGIDGPVESAAAAS